MTPSGEGQSRLGRRLRELRSGRKIKQADLAKALKVGTSSISTWESGAKIPPEDRLTAYATFFATERSLAGPPRMLEDLDGHERAERDRLLRELVDLRNAAFGSTRQDGVSAGSGGEARRGLWHYPEGEDVTIVCARIPERLLDHGLYTDPDSPDYVDMYTYADPDALIEAFGHIRAMNPTNQVAFRVAQDLVSDDLTSHLVLLGGVDFNDTTRNVLARFPDLPVRQLSRHTDDEVGGFEVVQEGRERRQVPKLRTEDGKRILEEDIAHVFWAPNPLNESRTVTVCNGTYGRGVYGAVRAITDARLRDENYSYLASRFGGGIFSILSRVVIFRGQVVTPNWTAGDIRLHEWPEAE